MTLASEPRPRGLRLSPWIVWVPGALFFCYAFFQRTAPSVMVEDMMRDFAIGAALVGNLSAFYFYAYAGLQLPVGMLLDRWGARRMLTTAMLLCAAGSALFATAEGLGAAYAGRLLIGAGSGFGWIGSLKLTADWFPPRRFALVAGLTTMFGMAGAIGGQAPLAALLEITGWREAMLGAGAAALALAALSWLLIRDRRSHAAENPVPSRTPGPLSGLRRAAANPQTWLTALYAGMVIAPLLAFAALWGVPYMMQAHGLDRPAAALATSVILVGAGIGGPTMGWFSDRIGRRKPAMFLCAGCQLVAFSAAIYLPGLPLGLILVLLFTMGVFSSGIVIGFAAGREANPSEVAGTAAGIINTAVMGGGAMIQPVIGLLLDVFWDGRIEAGIRVYSTETFQTALLILPACLVGALVAALFVRETWCRPVTQPA